MDLPQNVRLKMRVVKLVVVQTAPVSSEGPSVSIMWTKMFNNSVVFMAS